MFLSIFSTIGYVLNIYSYLCIAYIFLSWFLNPAASRVGTLLSEVCAPYLNWFKRFRFTQIGVIDFSPILALGVLALGSNLFSQIAAQHSFSLFGIIKPIIIIVWSFFSFIINIFILALILRLILDFLPAYRSGNIAFMLDSFLSPLFVRVNTLMGARFMTARKQIVISLVLMIVLRVVTGAFFGSASVLFKHFILL